MENPEDYQYDIDVSEVKAGYGGAVALLAVGYLILPLMFLRGNREPSKLRWGSQR